MKAAASAWANAVRDVQEKRAALDAVADNQVTDRTRRIVTAYAAAERKLLRLSAPTLGDVAVKLELLWEDTLYDPHDPLTEARRIVLSDILRLGQDA